MTMETLTPTSTPISKTLWKEEKKIEKKNTYTKKFFI